VVITMRGSVSLKNWVTDIKYWPLDCSKITGIPGAECETGFLNFWEESKKKGALTEMDGAIAKYPDYAIVVTGHSLGGAAALIAASELRKTHPKVTAYTYGQPRVGNMALSQGITSQGNNFR
jgi:putative lipase involved disintegration of autophagic bodies